MKLIPASIRNLLARRKPSPPRCTPDNLEAAGLPPNAIADLRGCSHDAFCGGAIPAEAYRPANVFDQLVIDELHRAGDPTPDDIARRGEGE